MYRPLLDRCLTFYFVRFIFNKEQIYFRREKLFYFVGIMLQHNLKGLSYENNKCSLLWSYVNCRNLKYIVQGTISKLIHYTVCCLAHNIIHSLYNVHKYFIYNMYYNKQHLMYIRLRQAIGLFYMGRNIYDKKLSLCNAYEKNMVFDCVPDKSSNIFLVNRQILAHISCINCTQHIYSTQNNYR